MDAKPRAPLVGITAARQALRELSRADAWVARHGRDSFGSDGLSPALAAVQARDAERSARRALAAVRARHRETADRMLEQLDARAQIVADPMAVASPDGSDEVRRPYSWLEDRPWKRRAAGTAAATLILAAVVLGATAIGRHNQPAAVGLLAASPGGAVAEGRSSPTAPTAPRRTTVTAFDFDTVRMNSSNLGEWKVSPPGGISVAAVPTAVRRSAQLQAGAAMCLPVPPDSPDRLLETELILMLEPGAALSLSYVLGEERVGVGVLDGAPQHDRSGEPFVELPPETWHTVYMTFDPEAVKLWWTIRATEGNVAVHAGEATIPPGTVTEFCIDANGEVDADAYLDAVTLTHQVGQ